MLISKAPLDWLWRERRTAKLLEPLAFVGRYPLTIYGVHLSMLAIIVALANDQFISWL